MILLAYPSVAAPTALVQLPDVEQLPDSRPQRSYQVQHETDAGTVAVYDFGGGSSAFTLTLSPLSDAQINELRDFWSLPVGSGGVDKMAGVWELLDSKSRLYKVRFAQDVFEPMPRGVSYYEMSLTVRVVP